MRVREAEGILPREASWESGDAVSSRRAKFDRTVAAAGRPALGDSAEESCTAYYFTASKFGRFSAVAPNGSQTNEGPLEREAALGLPSQFSRSLDLLRVAHRNIPPNLQEGLPFIAPGPPSARKNLQNKHRLSWHKLISI
ncbi:hypothetical protein NQZ68_016196 [Dissostichus eleginoides]|nr:hypothetical protein NQZ68_016196 [Dissostichus eleginoides]